MSRVLESNIQEKGKLPKTYKKTMELYPKAVKIESKNKAKAKGAKKIAVDSK